MVFRHAPDQLREVALLPPPSQIIVASLLRAGAGASWSICRRPSMIMLTACTQRQIKLSANLTRPASWVNCTELRGASRRLVVGSCAAQEWPPKRPELASGALLSRLEHDEMRFDCRGNGSALPPLCVSCLEASRSGFCETLLRLQEVMAGHDHRKGIC